MTYHNGSVEQSVAVYTIFWSPSNTISSNYKTLINQYFQDIGGSAFYKINLQYGMQNSSVLGGTWSDSAGYPHAGTPSDPLTNEDIKAEVSRALSVNSGWNPPGLTKMYFVYTQAGAESCADPDANERICTPGVGVRVGHTDGVYCAYHSWFGGNIIFANMPYGETWPEACRLNPGPNGDAAADGEISTSAHEHFEAATDPELGGWYDTVLDDAGRTQANEIADKCAYDYGTTGSSNVTLNGHSYLIQRMWSNASSGCTTAYNGPFVPLPNPSCLDIPAFPADGSLYRIGQQIYVFYGGAKFAVPDEATVTAMGLNPADIVCANSLSYPSMYSLPSDGTVLRELYTSNYHLFACSARFSTTSQTAINNLVATGAVSQVHVVPAGTVTTITTYNNNPCPVLELNGSDYYMVCRGKKWKIANSYVRTALGGTPELIFDGALNGLAVLPKLHLCGDDDDYDGWSNVVENYLGTDGMLACPANTGANNEKDAWPFDMNDNQFVNGQDTGQYGFGHFNVNYQSPLFLRRLDLSVDGTLSGQDTGMFSAVYNTRCTTNSRYLKTGDINCDGSVNISDATRIEQYLAGLTYTIPPNCPDVDTFIAFLEPSGPEGVRFEGSGLFGDVNCDGAVTAQDANLVQQYDVGIHPAACSNVLPPHGYTVTREVGLLPRSSQVPILMTGWTD